MEQIILSASTWYVQGEAADQSLSGLVHERQVSGAAASVSRGKHLQCQKSHLHFLSLSLYFTFLVLLSAVVLSSFLLFY